MGLWIAKDEIAAGFGCMIHHGMTYFLTCWKANIVSSREFEGLFTEMDSERTFEDEDVFFFEKVVVCLIRLSPWGQHFYTHTDL
jgi:hypothetical protein